MGRLGDRGEDPRGGISALAAARHPLLYDGCPRGTAHRVAGDAAGAGLGRRRDGEDRAREHRDRAVHGLRHQLEQRLRLAAPSCSRLPADGGLPAEPYAGNPGKAGTRGGHRGHADGRGTRATAGHARGQGSPVDPARRDRSGAPELRYPALDRRGTRRTFAASAGAATPRAGGGFRTAH